MARLCQNAILYNWKPVFAYIPIESNIEKFQGEYYEVIERCHRNGESTAFIEFMLRQTDSFNCREIFIDSLCNFLYN